MLPDPLPDPLYLSLDEVLELHRDALAKWGGSDGVRDRGALESALAMPRASAFGKDAHTSVFDKAAAYAFHVAEAQAFVDGNKRTGLACAMTFLALNGVCILYDAASEFNLSEVGGPYRVVRRKGGILFAAMKAMGDRRRRKHFDKWSMGGLLFRLAQPKDPGPPLEA